MPVLLAKLWGDTKFQKLSPNSKLVYIYLAYEPSISIVGVVRPNINILPNILNIPIEGIKEGVRELKTKKYIHVSKYEDGEVYFVVLDHFNTIIKSDASVTRINKALSGYPTKLVEYLETVGIKSDVKVVTFSPPTPEEVSKFALSGGYLINGGKLVDFYKSMGEKYKPGSGLWYNSYGKVVKDWKATMRKVWFKPENKLKAVKGSPKGFEFFFVMHKDNMVVPEKWKNGKPWHSNIMLKVELEKEFDNNKN